MNVLAKLRTCACVTVCLIGWISQSNVAWAQQLKPIGGSKKVEPHRSAPAPAAVTEKTTDAMDPVAKEPVAKKTSEIPSSPTDPAVGSDRSATANLQQNPLQPATRATQDEAEYPPIITVTTQPDPIPSLPRITQMLAPSIRPASSQVAGQPVDSPRYIENQFAAPDSRQIPATTRPLRPYLPSNAQTADMSAELPPIIRAAGQPAALHGQPAIAMPSNRQVVTPGRMLHPHVTDASGNQPGTINAEPKRGANFPADAQRRIADFIEANQKNFSLIQQQNQQANPTEETASASKDSAAVTVANSHLQDNVPVTSESEVESGNVPVIAREAVADESGMAESEMVASENGAPTPAASTVESAKEMGALQAGANRPVQVPMVAEPIATVEQASETTVAEAAFEPESNASTADSNRGVNNPRLAPGQFPNHQPIQPVRLARTPSVLSRQDERVAQVESYPPISTPITQSGAAYPNQDVTVEVVPGGGSTYFDQGNSNIDADVVVDYSSPTAPYGDYGFTMDARNYFLSETLIWHRSDGDFRAGNFNVMDEFDWNYGGRVTWGSRWDCAEGREISVMAFDPWTARTVERNPTGTLIGAVFAGGGLNNGDISAFRFQTNYLEQWQKSELFSFEANRVWWGWDVAKTFLGIRYMSFDDKFGLSASNLFGQQGFYTIDATNEMLGIHTGAQANYDYGRRVSCVLSGGIGGYLNFMDGGQTLINDGQASFANRVRDTRFAGSLQLGAYLNIKLAPRMRAKVGYEFLSLYNVMTTQAAYRPVVTPRSGSSIERENTLFHGGVIGFEFYR